MANAGLELRRGGGGGGGGAFKVTGALAEIQLLFAN